MIVTPCAEQPFWTHFFAEVRIGLKFFARWITKHH